MRALNSSGYKTRGCYSPAGRVGGFCCGREKARGRRQKDEIDAEAGGCYFDAYDRRHAVTAIKCFRVHNF